MTKSERLQMFWALEKAIEHQDGTANMAEKLGVSRQAINQWKTRGIPAERAVQIEKLLEGQVSRKQLRPDLFTDCMR
jgi:DNA-binding transcriptional regulator YdaS (Cro superfamily)